MGHIVEEIFIDLIDLLLAQQAVIGKNENGRQKNEYTNRGEQHKLHLTEDVAPFVVRFEAQ